MECQFTTTVASGSSKVYFKVNRLLTHNVRDELGLTQTRKSQSCSLILALDCSSTTRAAARSVYATPALILLFKTSGSEGYRKARMLPGDGLNIDQVHLIVLLTFCSPVSN